MITITVDEILLELHKAEKKHPEYPSCMFRQVAIMNEEAGEVTKAVLHFHYEKGSIDHVKEELIQTAAMCIRMIENLDMQIKYNWTSVWRVALKNLINNKQL